MHERMTDALTQNRIEATGRRSGNALASAIRAAAREVGYAACGLAKAEPFPEYTAALDRLVQRAPGLADELARLRVRSDPRVGAPWARSLVICVRRYHQTRLPPGLAGHIGRNYLCDRRVPAHPEYAWPRRMTDALRALELRVKRGSGASDRLAAARAGVVELADNGFAVTPEDGSWINIEAWRVDAVLPPDEPSRESPCPPGCRRCIEACPTGALCAPRTMRMDRCIAWLTYHAPWPVDGTLWTKMGPWVYGCDACQDVCPLNRGKWTGTCPAPWLEERAALLRPAGLARMADEEYRRFVHPLFWYISEDDAERWRANARRALAAEAAGNVQSPTGNDQ